MNLPNKFTIEVTEEDIKAGDIRSCSHCPIALSLKRRFGIPISVNANYAHIGIDNILYFHDGIRFIFKFDRGEHVEPCSISFRKGPE